MIIDVLRPLPPTVRPGRYLLMNIFADLSTKIDYFYVSQGSFSGLGFAEIRLDGCCLIHHRYVPLHFLMDIFVDQCTKYAIPYVSQESFSCLGFAETRPDHELSVVCLYFIHHRPLNFHSPSIAVLSSTIDDRYATLPFTTDPRTCIHHRPLRFHSPSTAALSFGFDLLSKWVCKVSLQGEAY